MPKPEDVRPEGSADELERLLRRRFAALDRSIDSTGNGGVYAIYFRYKGAGYWQGVVKRIRSDGGGLEVAFSRGGSFATAFKDLNASIQNDAWRPDKPWRAGGGE